MIEIIVTGIIVIATIYIIYKNVKKGTKGECNCGTCSAKCPNRKE